MHELNEQGSKSIRRMLTTAAVMALVVALTVLYSAFETASHRDELALSEEVANASGLIERVPSVVA
ncbi:MAG: hypothetical protein M0Z34_01065, partial [Nitrospiraceae bacterium]|nr:hypothetical protein [Nitrospiraceae bacterium]